MTDKVSKISRLFILFAFCIFIAGSSWGQFYFGKNKVQYTKFDWQVMETKHFRIYFYIEEEEIAQIAAKIAEDSYAILASRFKQEIYSPIPLIIYSSPNYFSQTNVTSSIISESVGGFTEFLKGRVVVPFHGSYKDFEHVVRHELVHVFTISKLESVMTKQRFYQMAPPPLWFIEGLAEYWSTDWDTEADMILKDMVLAGKLFSISDFHQISGTYFMYKLGQSVCQFINDEYGSDKLVLLFENWWKGKDFEQIIRLTLEDNMNEVSDKWEYYLKKKYFPQIASRGLTDRESKQLTKSGYEVKGVPIKLGSGRELGEWIIFKANKLGYSGLYMMPPDGEEHEVYTLLKGESSANYESLHLLQSGIDANDSGFMIFSSKSQERDVLYLFDLNRKRVVSRFEFPELISIVSPRLSGSGKQAVFSGAGKNGITDIYTIDLETGALRKITDDFYYDNDPAFTPNADSIIFSTDRCADGDAGAMNLYKISINGGEPVALTSGKWRDISPDVTTDGIYFSSDREGAFNIYRLDNDGICNRITSLLIGAYDPRLTPDRKSILFSGYQNFGFHIYRIAIKDSALASQDKMPAGKVFWHPGALEKIFLKSTVEYQTAYSFDIAQSAISYDPVYGSIGGLQVALSDMLGNKAFYFLLTNTAESKNKFFSSFNFAVTYLNKKNRLNWGAGIYHLYDEYYNDYEGYYNERQAGGLGLLNYPLSKFCRLETTTYLRYSDKNSWLYGRRRQVLLMSNYFSYISDNSLWDISGPIEGHRYNLTFGITTAIDRGGVFNRLGLVDLRSYRRLGKYSAFASRLFWFSSSGVEPQRIYFGGSWSFRGYSRRAFYNRNILFASNELRFPLIDNLLVGFPFGGIGFQAIRGAIFFDAGSAWDDHFDRFLGSFGAGFRVALDRIVVLRFDFTRTTDFRTIGRHTQFEFFFGWNF